MLERDVNNMTSYYGQFAPELLGSKYAKEMWALYEDGKLHPDFPTKEKFLEEYKKQVTCEYALDHRKLPIDEQFEYLYVERLTGCTAKEFENIVNQLEVMAEQLERYGINRRTQAITWIPEIDLYSDEPPCLQRLWVRPLSFDMQIPNEKIPIEFHLTWRSRDGKKAWMTNEVAILFMMYRYVFKDKYEVVKIVDILLFELLKLVVELIGEIAMEDGLRFAIREGGRTVGAGVVTKILK